ncbi:hypothetical protein [Gordonia sp. NPDC058843]|uniref:hypothetical protein n=1 Tax=Gordonia sp. NPDC058843 TaxID=3346648 RepID=UPI0036C91052
MWNVMVESEKALGAYHFERSFYLNRTPYPTLQTGCVQGCADFGGRDGDASCRHIAVTRPQPGVAGRKPVTVVGLSRICVETGAHIALLRDAAWTPRRIISSNLHMSGGENGVG